MLAEKVDSRLEGIDVHYAMRYQSPSIRNELEKILLKNPDEIIVLPLFPHWFNFDKTEWSTK